MSFDAVADYKELAREDADPRPRRTEPVGRGDEVRQLRDMINAGLEEHFDGEDEEPAGNEALSPLEQLQARLDKEFYKLDQTLDLLDRPEKVAAQLVAKWAVMVDLAKSYGLADNIVADLFTALVIGKVIQAGPDGVTMKHERDVPGEDNYHDVIQVIVRRRELGRLSSHPSELDDRYPQSHFGIVNTPAPMLSPQVIDAIKQVVPSFEVERPDHNRRYASSANESLWRLAARAEYLSEARKLMNTGLDIRAIATEVFGGSSGIDTLLAFLAENQTATPRELAEKWSGEAYQKPPVSEMTEALQAHDTLQQEIRAQE